MSEEEKLSSLSSESGSESESESESGSDSGSESGSDSEGASFGTPAGFVKESIQPLIDHSEVVGKDKEVWLIRVPNEFDCNVLKGKHKFSDNDEVAQFTKGDLKYSLRECPIEESSNLINAFGSLEKNSVITGAPFKRVLSITSVITPPAQGTVIKTVGPPEPKTSLKLRFKPLGFGGQSEIVVPPNETKGATKEDKKQRKTKKEKEPAQKKDSDKKKRKREDVSSQSKENKKTKSKKIKA
eukprot:GCRY01003804.1.p1 GENE.GCRY01003804.1~~GCRY01003804.1.p1  ORF type:complete len:248 (-),score=36.67 GCRY01003804.1:101-823(-)